MRSAVQRGTPEDDGKRVTARLGCAALLLAAGAVTGCANIGSAPSSSSPASDTLSVGFGTDRIELSEGEGTAVNIEFVPSYGSPPDADAQRWTFDLRVVVEPESAADLLVGAFPFAGYGRFAGPERDWLAIHALPDGERESAETFTLRLEAAPPTQGRRARAVRITNGEVQVVIRDADTERLCSEVRITATPPRRLTRPGFRRWCPSWGVFETEVTVEADRNLSLPLERLGSYGRIDGWRIESVGPRIRHHLVLQWDLERSAEMRVQVCPAGSGGSTLVCDDEACEIYAAGPRVPAPASPLVCR